MNPRRRTASPPQQPRTLADVPPDTPGLPYPAWYCRLPHEQTADLTAWAALDAERTRAAEAEHRAATQRQQAKKRTARKGAGE